jgi:hypothetical protein
MCCIRLSLLTFCAALLGPAISTAGPCDALFKFDGNLSDSIGNTENGVMIAAGGAPAKPVFVEGRSGQALRLDGTSSMRVSHDLHYDVCPQVTIMAWINIGSDSPRRTQSILSTGYGSGPGIRFAGTNLSINGTGNGMMQQQAVRPNGGWQFVAASYDFDTSSYTLYWGNRNSKPQVMGGKRAEWENAFWVGALNDSLSGVASGILVDDVRIVGRSLSQEQILALKSDAAVSPEELPGDQFTPGQQLAGSRLDPNQLPGDQFDPTHLPGDQFESKQLPGDQFEPKQLPGDQFDPKQLPGDQFDPKQLPGDQFDPKQLPGDQFDPAQPTNRGSGIPSGAMGTNTTGTGMSIDTDAAIASRPNQAPVLPGATNGSSSNNAGIPSGALGANTVGRDVSIDTEAAASRQNQPPVLPGATSESSADKATPAPASESQDSAVANIPPRPVGNNKFSDVAGYPGTNQVALTSVGNFINGIMWREVSDRPCRMTVVDHDDNWVNSETVCGTDANPLNNLLSDMPSVALSGPDRVIGRLEVCNNNNSNKRMKGMRIWGSRILADGSIQYEPNSASKALPNCRTWSGSVLCPLDSYATGVIIHSSDRGDITGLQLVCRAIL